MPPWWLNANWFWYMSFRYGDFNVTSTTSPGMMGCFTFCVSPVTVCPVLLYQYSSTLSSAIAPVDTFLICSVVTMSSLTRFGAPLITST